MAGTYLHLHLAIGAFATSFGASAGERPREHAAFLAGAVAPDLGFFPGGPATFSRRAHHECTADLARALLVVADDATEEAFAAGWALHVYTDAATHPVVNRLADDHRVQMSDQPAARLDLWHKRVEWGIDCHVLSQAAHKPPLWRQALVFPAEPGDRCQLARAARDIFGEDADDGALRKGWAATERWVRRLAPMFLWTGSLEPAAGGPAAMFGRLFAPVARRAGRALHNSLSHEDAAALLVPIPPTTDIAESFLRTAAEAVDAYQDGWAQRFADLPNLDLDTGEPVTESQP